MHSERHLVSRRNEGEGINDRPTERVSVSGIVSGNVFHFLPSDKLHHGLRPVLGVEDSGSPEHGNLPFLDPKFDYLVAECGL